MNVFGRHDATAWACNAALHPPTYGAECIAGPQVLGEVRHPEREEPYRTVGAVHPLRRALV